MTDSYKKALAEAKRELKQIAQERDRLNQRILQLQGVISSLAGMLPDPDEAIEEMAEAEEIIGPSGLTDAIRSVLRWNATRKWSAVGVRDELAKGNFPLGEYSNALSAIHTILKRLQKQGQVEASADGHYRWIGPHPLEKLRVPFKGELKIGSRK